MTSTNHASVPGEAVLDLGDVQNKLDSTIAARLGSQVQGVELSWRDGAIVIRGRANSYYAKQIAEQIVMAVVGPDIPVWPSRSGQTAKASRRPDGNVWPTIFNEIEIH